MEEQKGFGIGNFQVLSFERLLVFVCEMDKKVVYVDRMLRFSVEA